MKGSIKEAESHLAQNPSYFMPDQFSNPANPATHKMTTAVEIWDALWRKDRRLRRRSRHRWDYYRMRENFSKKRTHRSKSLPWNRRRHQCCPAAIQDRIRFKGSEPALCPRSSIERFSTAWSPSRMTRPIRPPNSSRKRRPAGGHLGRG